MARQAGGIMTMNTVLVGAAFDLDLIPIKESSIIEAIKDILPTRYHEMNITAFKKGMTVQKLIIKD
jgi:Pyruvate/2-oxoacid:ferredoxin oxidoreductase gamma subunit